MRRVWQWIADWHHNGAAEQVLFVFGTNGGLLTRHPPTAPPENRTYDNSTWNNDGVEEELAHHLDA